MKTLCSLFVVGAIVVVATPARAQIDPLGYESSLATNMQGTIQRCATPIMRLLTKDHRAFTQTNKPDYKTNDVPYEFKTKQTSLEGVLLCPVSGHVPFGSRDTTVMQRNARKFADHNETTLIVNGQKIASVKHNGNYVARLPFKAQLKPGKNTVVMQQRNLKSGETAYVGGFPMGRQFNITVEGRATQNSALRGCRVYFGGAAKLRLGGNRLARSKWAGARARRWGKR